MSQQPTGNDIDVVQYLPLVRKIARTVSLHLQSLEEDDLVGYGVLGLVEAARRFDPTRGVPFEPYAITRIRGAILDAQRTHDVLGRTARRNTRTVAAGRAHLLTKLQREPSRAELAAELDMTPLALDRAMVEASTRLVSMEAPVGRASVGDRPLAIIETIADPWATDPCAPLEQHELLESLTSAVQELPDRDQLLLSLLYTEGLTLTEAATVLGVSVTRIGQIRTRAVASLRSRLVDGQAPAQPARSRASALRIQRATAA